MPVMAGKIAACGGELAGVDGAMAQRSVAGPL